MHSTARIALAVALLFMAAASAPADVRPHALFSEHCVLQQQVPVPVWGDADEGDTVTVSIQGQSVSATARGGRWMVTLAPLSAGGPFEMTIRGSTSSITLRDVLVGEVWLVSGQSNMGMGVGKLKEAAAIEAAGADPLLRLFRMPVNPCEHPQRDAEASWTLSDAYHTTRFSAVGYLFGRELRQRRGQPVGLVQSAIGGTLADTWIPRSYLESDPIFEPALQRWSRQLARLQATADPKVDPLADKRNMTSAQFNGMIAPLQPMALRGVAWYQGENDCHDSWRYRTTLPTLIKAWREGFGRDLPFLIVQLPNYHKIVTEPVESEWAELREAQWLTTQTVPNTALVVTVDCGDKDDPLNLHPPDKQTVAHRLALAAEARVYQRTLDWSGPIYAGARVEGDRIVVRFDHVAGGLKVVGDALREFTIAGADRKWFNAQAELRGRDEVAVWSPQVPQPVAVRYAWSLNPQVTLYNQADLPAAPFRTDDFPMITKPR